MTQQHTKLGETEHFDIRLTDDGSIIVYTKPDETGRFMGFVLDKDLHFHAIALDGEILNREIDNDPTMAFSVKFS